MKKKLLIFLACVVSIAGVLCGVYIKGSEINDTLDIIQDAIIEEINEIDNDVVVSEQTKELVIQTKEAIQNDEDISTTETIESTEQEEQNITDESALENDAVVEQENISYDGDNSGKGLSLLGSYQGLTYYSQADSRWANIMYSSTGNTSQTMKSSACGPTSAAMVVSSSKGAILPTTMAQLSVDNGYRTANNGTAWAYYSFVADYFDFNEYHTTSNFDTAMSYLSQKDGDGNSKYYIICSCGSGLFTTGGHYIVLVGLDNGAIQVYDPYLYSGKFTTASRKNAGAVVSGNSVFVSESSFKTYSNYKNFWIYSNDNGAGNVNTTNIESTSAVNYTRYVATQSANLNVRNNPNGTKIGSLAKGTTVNVVEVKGDWSRITSTVNGWASSQYLSASTVKTNVPKSTTIKKTVGQYKRLTSRTTMYSKSNLTGIKYSYLANTQVKIIKNVSSTVDYVYVVKTKRYAYIRNNVYR